MGDFHPTKFVIVFITICQISSANKTSTIKFPDDIESFSNVEAIFKKLKEKSENPVALLIEDQPHTFSLANYFFNNIHSSADSEYLDFWILKFNSTGVSNILVSSRNNIDLFKKSMDSFTSESFLDRENWNLSRPFFATLHAAQILPKNSTIIVFSKNTGVDENLAQLAFNAVFAKNITVHLYWDDTDISPNHYLKEISRHSGGQIFSLGNSHASFQNYQNFVFENYLNSRLSLLLTRKNQVQSCKLSFPIDSDVIGIYVSVSPWQETTLVLTSPTGYTMQFHDDDENDIAKKYSFGSFAEHQGEYLDVHLNFFNSARPTVGTWHLKIYNTKRSFKVTVYALTNITAQAFVEPNNKENQTLRSGSKDIVKIGVAGDVGFISDIIFVGNDGLSVIENITYSPDNDKKLPLKSNDSFSKDFNVELVNASKTKPAYAVVKGLDAKGNVFERLGYIFGLNKRNLYPQQTITVDVGVGSQLLVVPGEQSQVYFEVTNRGNDALNVFFSAADNRWMLQSLSAYRRVLNPQESYIVTLTLNRAASRSGAYQDEITFYAKGGGQVVQKKAIIDVGASLNIYDRSDPYLDHSYTSDCTEVIFKRCEQGTWTIEVTAQDSDSGILQVNSVPKGLYFPTSYTSGTLERVVGYYSDSCCNPDLQIIAVDRANNRRSYNVNAYHAIWSPGAIAALILGIIFFILLIALIVFLIIRCRRKTETYDLPTYRGGGI